MIWFVFQVEFKALLNTTKDLQFSVEVLEFLEFRSKFLAISSDSYIYIHAST